MDCCEDWGLVWPEYEVEEDAFYESVFQSVCDEEPVGGSFDLSWTYKKLLEKLKHKPRVIACDCYQQLYVIVFVFKVS